MTNWPATKAKRVLAALERPWNGWDGGSVARGVPTKVLVREDWPNYEFAFQEGEEIGPRMLSKIAKHTGLTPKDL